MSIAEIDLLPSPEPRRRPERSERPLRALEAPQKRRRPRLAYGIVAVTGAALIAAAQLGVSILTTQSTYELADVRAEQRQLTLDAQELREDIVGLASPQYLAANAAALGMVIDASPSFLRLSDGAVSGSGAASSAQSTVDIGSGSAAGNLLIADTPLVTDPSQTLETEQGAPVAEMPADVPDPEPLDGGLPAPATH